MAQKRDRTVMVVVLLVTAALCTAGIAALRWADAKQDANIAETPPERGVAVGVAVTAARQITSEVSTRGFLSPFEELTIAAEVSGPVESQNIEVSDRVSKGDVMYRIDNALHAVALDKALAEAGRAASDLHQAKENAKRVEGLQATNSANPTEVLEVETAVEKAQAMVRRGDASVAEARILLDKTAIVSPLTGVVARVHTRQGEYARVGQPLVEIIVIDRLKLTVQLDDREVVAFAPGDPVIMEAAAFPVEEFGGTILRIYPRAEQDSRKFEVEIEVPNADGRLRPGFFARAKLTPRSDRVEMLRFAQHDGPPARHDGPLARHDGPPTMVTIPRLAVLELYRQHYCYVVRRTAAESVDRAYWTLIETLPILSDPQNVQVISGLEVGDRVVTTGLQHVTHECVVRVVE